MEQDYKIDTTTKMIWNGWGITYPQFLKLQEELQQSGIEANVSAGGFTATTVGEQQASTLFEVCDRYGVSPSSQENPHIQRVMAKVGK